MPARQAASQATRQRATTAKAAPRTRKIVKPTVAPPAPTAAPQGQEAQVTRQLLAALLAQSEALEDALRRFAEGAPGARISAAATLQAQVTRCVNALAEDATKEAEQMRNWRRYMTEQIQRDGYAHTGADVTGVTVAAQR